MKPILILITILAFFLFSCGNNNQSGKADSSNTNKTEMGKGKALEIDFATLATKKDVVCGMSMSNVPIIDTTHVNGKVYPFCAKMCKETFLKDVDKYAINK